jgi:pilus assembly protein Flp/PilA
VHDGNPPCTAHFSRALVGRLDKGGAVMQSPVAVAVLKKIADAGRSEDGQDLLEYGLLAALIAVIAIGAVSTVGNTINTVFWQTIAIASSF